MTGIFNIGRKVSLTVSYANDDLCFTINLCNRAPPSLVLKPISSIEEILVNSSRTGSTLSCARRRDFYKDKVLIIIAQFFIG